MERFSPRISDRNRAFSQLERDAALARIGRVRRWMIVAAAGLTAGFAALVSTIAPGRSLAARARTSVRPATRTASTRTNLRMPPPASAGALGLQAPSAPPQAAPAPQAAPTPQSTPPASVAPQPAAPAPSPAPAPSASGASGGSGGVVSGGS